MVSRILRIWFGDFDAEELRKYLFLGLIFSIIIGTYWTLRPMKDAFFGCLIVGYGKTEGRAIYLALAKIVSLCLLFPVVTVYGKMVERFKKAQAFYVLTSFYAVCMMLWALFFMHPTWGLANTVADTWRLSGWLWYVFVESFGSLVIALFWAFTVDISTSQSAKRGFALIVMIGQFGGIVLPLYVLKIPRFFGTTSAPVIALCGIMVLITLGLFWLFVKTTPEDQMKGYRGKPVEEQEKRPGLMEGLKLLLTHKYLLGIFSLIAFFELIVTIIEFNFKSLVFLEFADATAAGEYLGGYGAAVNTVAFFCLLLGINNIQRWLGLGVALSLVPIAVGVAVISFKLFPELNMLFYLMIASKAISYALNSPAIKQLYIPTSKQVKYKSQAWIETFGSRGAKASASLANLSKGALGFTTYLTITVLFSLGLAAVWFFVALFLARRCNEAIEKKELVC
jgi:AAA family ATP:ADP antiporter